MKPSRLSLLLILYPPSFILCAAGLSDLQGFHYSLPTKIEVNVNGKVVTTPFTNNSAQFIEVNGITIGWYTRTIGAKQTAFLANQLHPIREGWDDLGSMFQNCPIESVVMLPMFTLQQVSPGVHGPWNQVTCGGSHFKNTKLKFPFGTGAVFKNPTTNTLTLFFSGVLMESTNYIPAGYSLTCCPKPIAGTIDELGFPKAEGDWVRKFDPDHGTLINFTNTASGWLPSVPSFEIGEAFAVDKVTAAVWTVSK